NMNRAPSRTSSRGWRAGRGGRGGSRTPDSNTTAQADRAAATPNADAPPTQPTSAPPSAGPAANATVRASSTRAFAAASASDGTRDGTSEGAVALNATGPQAPRKPRAASIGRLSPP